MKRPETEIYLHWVLHDYVLTVLLLSQEIDNASHNTPRVVHVQRHLSSELVRLELLSAEDSVLVGGSHVDTGNETRMRRDGLETLT